MDKIVIAISLGELADRLSILRLKQERIKDPVKLAIVNPEYAQLHDLWLTTITTGLPPDTAGQSLLNLYLQLYHVNAFLWDVEDAIREQERNQTFNDEFVRLARLVYHKNDQRAKLKQLINGIVHSPIGEVKSYAANGN